MSAKKNKQTTASHVASVVSIPGYEIKDLLGRGGMAMVYLAIQESIGRKVALKVLAPDHNDETFSERFLREARIASQLSHPNIITVYDAGIHNGIHYMSMEYIQGKNFNEARNLLTRKQKVLIIKQIADALDFAAKKGFIHRDIKPENILLHQDGRAILTDFGIARSNDISKGLTETGKILGTPYFMSPEQTKGLKIDHRTDIYSLGVVLFQALAGYVPYDGPSLVAICIKHLSDPIPQLPKGLEIFQPIINICLSKKPEHRYQHASELVAALNKITDIQLDSIDSNAAAFKKAGQNYNAATMVEQKSRPAKKRQQPPIATPTRKKSVSRPVTEATKSYKNRASPTFITDSDDFKNLNRRKSKILLLLFILLAAVVYHQKEQLVPVWNKQVKPLAKKYLPAEIKQYLFTNKKIPHPKSSKQPVKNPVLTVKQVEIAKIQQLEKSLNKIPKNAKTLAEIYNKKLQKNPDNPDFISATQKLKTWYITRLANLLQKKDLVTANKTIHEAESLYPEINKNNKFTTLKDKLAHDIENEPHLQKARVYFAVNALNEPKGANALEELKQVLINDPENEEALQGLQKIALFFKNKAEKQVRQNTYYKAMDSANAGLQAISNDNELLLLQKKIKTLVKNKNLVSNLLIKADRKFQEGMLIQPKKENAYDLYKKVLTIDSGNPRAKNSLLKIQKELLRQVRLATEQGKFRKAETILNQTQQLFSDNPQIQLTRKNLRKEMDAVLPIVSKIKISNTPFSIITETTLQKIKVGQLLYIGFQYRNFAQNNTKIRVNVYNGDSPVLIEQKEIILPSNQGDYFFTVQLPEKGITNGHYSIELMFGQSRLIKANLFGLH